MQDINRLPLKTLIFTESRDKAIAGIHLKCEVSDQAMCSRVFICGETGIRTLGPPKADNGFRDRPIQPLWHLSFVVQGYIFKRKITKGLFIRILICFIIPKSIEKLFGLVDIAVVPVAKNNDGC